MQTESLLDRCDVESEWELSLIDTSFGSNKTRHNTPNDFEITMSIMSYYLGIFVGRTYSEPDRTYSLPLGYTLNHINLLNYSGEYLL